jgi:tetratricopeptide (TPR) repeat protein
VEHYLRGRALARQTHSEAEMLEEAIEHFDQARVMAPAFALPLAAKADAVVRRWFFALESDGERWAQASREVVDEALAGAATLAETHQAAARLEVNRGDFAAAARHLNTALEIAPTYAAAHEYLGMLQCDTGRSREGVQHIELAHELDPTLSMGRFAALRHHAFRNDPNTYEASLLEIRRNPNLPRFSADLFEFRFSLWRHDTDRAQAIRWHTESLDPAFGWVNTAVDALDDSISDQDLAERLDHAATLSGNPRLRTTWRQISVEVLAWRGAHDAALAALGLTDTERPLFDADWLEQCPLLIPLRDHPTFIGIRQRARDRADKIWCSSRG